MIKVIVYGKSGCPACDKAKDLVNKSKETLKDFDYEYNDIYEKGLSAKELSEMAGESISTVPQIWVKQDENVETYLGGFDRLDTYLRNMIAKGTLEYK